MKITLINKQLIQGNLHKRKIVHLQEKFEVNKAVNKETQLYD